MDKHNLVLARWREKIGFVPVVCVLLVLAIVGATCFGLLTIRKVKQGALRQINNKGVK